jgi:hypothetical protein
MNNLQGYLLLRWCHQEESYYCISTDSQTFARKRLPIRRES